MPSIEALVHATDRKIARERSGGYADPDPWEKTSVERLKSYNHGCIVVQGNKARGPKLPTRSAYGLNAWLGGRHRPRFD